MTATEPDPIAPIPRLRTDFEKFRQYLPNAESALRQLRSFLDVSDEASARARLEEGLPELGKNLFASPYYREVLGARSLSPNDLSTLSDLEHFPVLHRQTLGRRTGDLPIVEPEDPRLADAVMIRSSGSTGLPVDVLRDGYELLHMWTVTRFWCDLLGVSLPSHPRVTLLCTLPSGLEYTARLPLFHDGRLERISTRKPAPLSRLLAFDPHVLFSDPAGLHWLATRDDVPAPHLVLTSAQTFSPAQREVFSNRVNAPVVNYYATSETGPIAWECLTAPGIFHVLSPEVFVESRGGRLLVTRLRPSLTPLLRYETGDTGQVSFTRCACGVAGFAITDFRGRRACHFVKPDGLTADAWQLAWLFKHLPLEDFLLEQTGVQRFLLRLYKPSGGPEEVVRCLAEALIRMGWTAPAIELEVSSELPPASAKPEPFVCHLGDANAVSS